MHGACVAKFLKESIPEVEIEAIGGENLKNTGVKLFCDHSKMSGFGFSLKMAVDHLKLESKLVKYLLEDYKPDLVLLIDYGTFNLRVAKRLKGSGIKVFDYMAEADGISDYWDIAKSRMDSISDYADGYKKLLSSGILTSTVINFLDGLSEADKAEHIQNVLSSSSGKTNSGSGILTEKAGTSWLWIIAAVGVGGYFLYKSGKKRKK